MVSEHDFPLEPDHVVIFVTPEAPELRAIPEMGLQPYGERTEHTGMGTASTAVFFDNAYLELIWFTDEQLARQTMASAKVDMTGRALGTGRALPFNIVMRRREGTSGPLPFSTNQMQAKWMDPPLTIELSDNGDEPLYMVIPRQLSYPGFRDHLRPTVHPNGARSLTGVQVTAPGLGRPSEIPGMLQEAGLVTFREGDEPLLELTLDGGAQGRSADARPTLPLVVRF